MSETTHHFEFITKDALREKLGLEMRNPRFNRYWERAEELYDRHKENPICDVRGKPLYVPVYLGSGERTVCVRMHKMQGELCMLAEDVDRMAKLNKVRFDEQGEIITDKRKNNVQPLVNFSIGPDIFIPNHAGSRYQRWITENLHEMGGRGGIEDNGMNWEEFKQLSQQITINNQDDRKLLAAFTPKVDYDRERLSVSEVLRVGRNQKGDLLGRMTNEDIAEHSRMQPGYVRKIMNGEAIPTAKEFEHLAKLLSVPKVLSDEILTTYRESPKALVTGVTNHQMLNALDKLKTKHGKEGVSGRQ